METSLKNALTAGLQPAGGFGDLSGFCGGGAGGIGGGGSKKEHFSHLLPDDFQTIACCVSFTLPVSLSHCETKSLQHGFRVLGDFCLWPTGARNPLLSAVCEG